MASENPSATTTPTPAQAPAAAPTSLIYAGTTIPGLVAQGTVYKLPFPAHLQVELDARPTLKGFFVPIDQFHPTTQKFRLAVGAMQRNTIAPKKGGK